MTQIVSSMFSSDKRLCEMLINRLIDCILLQRSQLEHEFSQIIPKVALTSRSHSFQPEFPNINKDHSQTLLPSISN